MKKMLHAFGMCQSMFCAIPSPWQGWDEKAKDRILDFLPLVGLEIGLLWTGLAYLCRYLGLPVLMMGAVVCAFPYIATGFMHLDGFMDVMDAVKSWRDLERRREILKDSRVGSFSVIGCILLILFQFACASTIAVRENFWILSLIPVVSRCGSALAVSLLPPMETSQYAGQKKTGGQIFWLMGILVLALAAGFLLRGREGFALLGVLGGYGLGLLRAYRSLKGMNGDIAGYSLSLGELAGLALWAVL